MRRAKLDKRALCPMLIVAWTSKKMEPLWSQSDLWN